jgi:hypothetical protein
VVYLGEGARIPASRRHRLLSIVICIFILNGKTTVSEAGAEGMRNTYPFDR